MNVSYTTRFLRHYLQLLRCWERHIRSTQGTQISYKNQAERDKQRSANYQNIKRGSQIETSLLSREHHMVTVII